MSYMLELAGIRMCLGGRPVLNGLNLSVGAGESVALLGTSGSGKTTALRVAAGFLHPEQGKVLLEGRDITSEAPEHRRMAMIHQHFLLFPHLDVAGNVAFGLPYVGVPNSEHAGHVKRLLALVGLEGLERRYPHQLSGGQQQRVAIARALAVQPRVLLLDEPLNSLDSTIREYLLDQLSSLRRSTGMTMLYVTHDQNEAARISHRVALLDGGRILQTGPYADLLECPASLQAARVLGLRNLFQVRRTEKGIEIPSLALHLAVTEPVADGAVAYLPPDRLRVCSGPIGLPRIDGIVEEILPGPLITRLRVSRGDATVEAAMARTALVESGVLQGAPVTLSIDPAHVRLLPDEAPGA
jgi:ABC-type Fe3+/spermidine/putrescine transport system ATPase subunit